MAAMALLAGASSCSDQLDVINPNQQTTSVFGNSLADLESAVIACYNHSRMEGTYSRYGYAYDILRGDEVYNAGQVWWLPADALNMPVTDEMSQWIWRDWYYTINVANFVISKTSDIDAQSSDEAMKRVKGQAAFFRGQGYYMLAVHYQNAAIITDYKDYTSLETLYQGPKPQAEVLAQAVSDLQEALQLLPTKNEGGQWEQGRATKAAAAALLAKVYMFQHDYKSAQTLLDNIINGEYGTYALTADYGANFREGIDENNSESIYEIQFLDYGQQGNIDEWTPNNNSKDATQGHAIEAQFGPLVFSGWADNAASPWLYNLFKAEKTTDGGLDPRLYWTLGTYEKEYDQYTGQKTAAYPDGDPRKNEMYQQVITGDDISTNGANGGIPVCKNTNSRTGLYDKIIAGLRCGINLRIIRLADVLLLAAECENEINGPTAKAFGYINQVRRRAALNDLDQSKFNTKDKLFEQIANVERPKELGCEFGRGIDLIRWGFFYDADRLAQIKLHGTAKKDNTKCNKDAIIANMDSDAAYISSFKTWNPGHEYLPIYQGIIDANPNMTGNSANNNIANTPDFAVHPVVNLD